jgi:uncharacterized protein (TIGR02001 family)
MKPLFAIACLAASGHPAAASAGEEGGSFRWSNAAALATEYVWRGQSVTHGKPAIVGQLKLSHDDGAYAGVWAGNPDPGPGTDTEAEVDYFAAGAKHRVMFQRRR